MLMLSVVACSSVRLPVDRPAPTAAARKLTPELEKALSEAGAAWKALEGASDDAARSRYNRAVSRVFADLRKSGPPAVWEGAIEAAGGAFEWAERWSSGPLASFSGWDEVRPASAAKRDKIRTPAVGDGLGVPVVLIRERREGRPTAWPFEPPTGVHNAATLVIAESLLGKPVLKIVDPRTTPALAVGNVKRPVAFDFSAPLEWSVGAPLMHKFDLGGVFRPDRQEPFAGLFTPERYDPKRIPVVFIHGFESAPHIFENPVNELAADPELRQRYQAWYFLYPTGLPVPTSAARLREALDEASRYATWHGGGSTFQQTVLVGHSMGGLLAKFQVVDSGDTLWNACFTKPAKDTPLPEASMARMQRALVFKHRPYVSRVIFITTPHRGSEMAEKKLIQPLVGLIRLPDRVRMVQRDLAALGPAYIQPDFFALSGFGARGVPSMSTRYPIIRALDTLPIHAHCDSILADRGKSDGDRSKGFDGYVHYSSAHLPAADYEVILPVHHLCIEHPILGAELARLLKQKLPHRAVVRSVR